jgi:outer membrane protein TolC
VNTKARTCTASLTIVPLIGLIALCASQAPALAAEKLTLQTYLKQVSQQNEGVVGARMSAEGASLRSSEGKILLSPLAFALIQYSDDKRPSLNPVFTYNEQRMRTYSLGVSELTSFGLQAKLSYNFNYLQYLGTAVPFPGFYQGGPTLELTQSLWRNFLGAETRATQAAIEAQALASYHSSNFQVRAALADAEASYWRLALARENVEVSRDALARAEKIHEWSTRRVKLNLADIGDAYQSQAALEGRKLQLQAALDEQHAAALAFNRARGVASDQVQDELDPVDNDRIGNLAPPSRAELREDTLAAKEAARATEANADASRSKDLPNLEIFGSASFNGQQTQASKAIPQSFSLDQPTWVGGVRFSVPLSLGLSSRSREGWALEKEAAQHAFERKKFEEQQDWADLLNKLTEAKTRLSLARTIEATQLKKLENERLRLNRGRTTTYQVLLFEQDYAQSQLSRIQAQADVLTLIARMKLWSPA